MRDVDAQVQMAKKFKSDVHVGTIQGVAFTANIVQLSPHIKN